MSNARKVLRTEFGPEARFEVSPLPPEPFRAGHEDELERLKNRLLVDRLGSALGAEENSQVRRAANEAAALAWLTKYPFWCSHPCSRRRPILRSSGWNNRTGFGESAGS